MKILLGILLGICASLLLHSVLQDRILKKSVEAPKSELIPSLKELLSVGNSSVDDKIALAGLDEKLNSVNKRIDDLYVFGGIIITLLLAIIVGVYVKAQSEVDYFFKENYEKYQIKVRKASEESDRILGELKTKVELTLEAREIRGPDQTTLEYGNDNEKSPT